MFVSRASGDDGWSCEHSKPCKTIWRAVTLASRGDRIHLDGTNTDKDPYTCQSGTLENPGIYINRSLSLIGFGAPLPQIRCTVGTGLTFNGSDDGQPMEVTLSGLLVKESFVNVQDSFANIDGCKFEGSVQGVKFVIRTKMVSSIQITNSAFSKSKECISVIVNRANNLSQNTQVVFKLTNSSFDDNALSDEGPCISFAELPYNNRSVSCNISLGNVTFSRNKFGPRGLVFMEMANGSQNIHLEDVTFFDNIPSSDGVSDTVDGNSECIVRSTDVNIFMKSSNFTSQNARSFNVSASNILLQIDNSSFRGHRVEGNGGVISMRGTDLCKLNVSHSSFVNTTAAQGGAINIECANADSLSFQDTIYTGNTAGNGEGGAVYIDVFDSGPNDSKYSTNSKGELDYSSRQSAEQPLLQINVTRCNFSNAYSSSQGGAVYINVPKASMRLRHLEFTNCTCFSNGGAVFVQTGSTSLKTKSSNHSLLIMESSHFTKCRSVNSGGSLTVLYKTQIELSINNSNFISSYTGGTGGAVGIFPSHFGRWRANTTHITITHSTFSNNSAQGNGGAISIAVNNQSILIMQSVIVESSREEKGAGAVFISPISTIEIYQSRFLKNTGVVFLLSDVNVLEVQDSLFNGNFARSSKPGPQQYGGAIYIGSGPVSTSILITNTTFKNCSAVQQGGAILIYHKGNVSLQLKKSWFVNNVVFDGFRVGFGGAIFLSLSPDTVKSPGCIQEDRVSVNPTGDTKEFPSWAYKSHLIFEDTTFERNAGYAGGAVYLANGKATFRNCSFINNFAATLGGHIYTVAGSASVVIQDSVFRQTINELQLLKMHFSKGSFIHAEGSGALNVYNTTMDAQPYASANPLMLVTNGRLIDVGNNNLTTFYCPVGSQMEITQFSNIIKTQVNNKPCKLKVSILEFSCLTCAGNSYSLQRGRALGTQLVPGFQCLPCPFGANCSQNILAKPNFWGFKEHDAPPTLKFTMCPLGYCSPPQKTDFPEYNACQGNRTGELCGQCNESYTETLYSTNCRPSHECHDYWFWPVALLYVSLMALYFTFKPPIVPWIKRQILWFKRHEPENQDNNFDRGYLKIVFYFYQAANLLLVSNSSQFLIKTKLIEPFVGLFNFHQILSSGLICPFSGLMVVTKQLFSASHVFGTLLVIGAFYVLRWGVQKFRGQGPPSVGPYIGGVLQTVLLGYTTLASVSFSLLRCVPIGSAERLFYDGNDVCFQWWQYILIAFICTFFVPFVFVLLWGSFKLYDGTLSVGKFLLACSFPLPSFIHWVFISLPFCKASKPASEDSLQGQISKNSVERVLYDSFKRPEDGGKLSLSWESVMIGRRLILIVLKVFVSDPMPRLFIMSFCCVLFLLHHALTQPFRDGIVNAAETISLLSIVLLGMINMFLASFVSLAVPLNDHFSSWLNFCQVVEIVILCAIPVVFCLFLVTAFFSQICRLTVAVCRFLHYLFWVCFSWFYSRQEGEIPVLAAVS